ncbi:MAG: mandelate racemase/muconate lactonizing enzyme family protein, partial [bacterium]|nr:mandelate racemase/muconate lactonizing enzyme family protein [bacterium]
MNDRLTIITMNVQQVRVPLPRPLAVSTFELPGVDTCCVTLRTREGLDGIGWCFAFGPEKLRALTAMVRDSLSAITGKDPRNTEENWDAMRKAASFVGREGVSACAIGALDTACWDIAAKAAGQPLWKYLGGTRREIPCYASEGLWLNAAEDELREEAAALIASGHKALKHRVGKADLQEDVRRTAAVREAIGDKTLMVDANQGWSVARAKEACAALKDFDLEWMEEPVDHEDVRGCAEVRASSAIPICQGETNYGPRGHRHLMAAGACDVLMADLQRCAGITGWLKSAKAAKAHGLPITPHLFHEVSAHLLSATEGSIWCEHMPWWEPALKSPMALKDGHLILSDAPGLGVEWNPEALKEFVHPAGGF